jgi:hypothetical protein
VAPRITLSRNRDLLGYYSQYVGATGMSAFDHVVTNIEELRGVVEAPPPGTRTLLKERTTFDAHCRAFIAHSPFLLIATADAGGRCDVSPKGDAPASFKYSTTAALRSRIGLATNVSTGCRTY